MDPTRRTTPVTPAYVLLFFIELRASYVHIEEEMREAHAKFLRLFLRACCFSSLAARRASTRYSRFASLTALARSFSSSCQATQPRAAAVRV